KVFPYVAVAASLEQVVTEAYRLLEQGQRFYIGPRTPDDYLRELGLNRPAPLPPPRKPKRATSTPRVIPPCATRDAVLTTEALGEPPPVSVQRSATRTPPTLDPAFASRVAPLPAAPSVAPTRGRRRVLVVDDEEDIRRMLRRVLGERDLEV